MGFFTGLGVIIAIVILIHIARLEAIRYYIEKSRLDDEYERRRGGR